MLSKLVKKSFGYRFAITCSVKHTLYYYRQLRFSFPHMEIARWRAGHGVVGVFAAGGVHAVCDRSGLPYQAEGLPIHVRHVHHLDRY